jgi:hypothetical protein
VTCVYSLTTVLHLVAVSVGVVLKAVSEETCVLFGIVFKNEVALISLLVYNIDKKTFVSLHRSVMLITSDPLSACDCLDVC